ncbi:MAG TPA: hypothetical protein PLQ67_09955 [Burkholderiaceae bacterium]|nr:hypothetical protein [Burkholderiaceae bacterium]
MSARGSDQEKQDRAAGRWLDEQLTTRWEKRLLEKSARSAKPAVIEAANRRMNRFLIRAGLVLFVLGLIFPANGTEGLGAIGTLIDWAAATVPSVAKAASISPMPKLVKGYLGALALLLPFMIFGVLYKNPLGKRFRFGFFRPGVSRVKLFLLIYVIGVPLLALALWAYWTFPGEPHLGLTPTRGQMIFHLMMTSRLLLAFFGAFLTVGISLVVWLFMVFVLGPIIYLTKQGGSHGSNTKRR